LAVKAGTVGVLPGNAGKSVPKKPQGLSNPICKRWAENAFALIVSAGLRKKGVWVGSLELLPANGGFAFELNFV